MPTPLPQINVPSMAPVIDAYRTGHEDFLAQKKRQLMQDAGGLAAVGNMGGARNKLYSGGEFEAARGVSGEMRAQSAEARAIQAHARSLDDAKLAKQAKMQELLGNMANAIKTPQQLEQAKAILSARGLDASGVQFEQLDLLKQQGITAMQAYQQELQERQMTNQEAQRVRAEFESDRAYKANRDDAAAMSNYRSALTRVQEAKANAAAAKAGAPKPLTEGQATARSFLGVMEDAQNSLRGSKEQPGILTSDDSESPMGHSSNFLATKAPDSILTSGHLDKRQKQYMQGVMQWVRAKLRKESGATISPDEFAADYRNFFPQPGDDIQTRRNKAKARKAVEQGFKTMGGFDAPGVPDAPAAADPAGMSDEELGALFQ